MNQLCLPHRARGARRDSTAAAWPAGGAPNLPNEPNPAPAGAFLQNEPKRRRRTDKPPFRQNEAKVRTRRFLQNEPNGAGLRRFAEQSQSPSPPPSLEFAKRSQRPP
jgi:hypothetical protein